MRHVLHILTRPASERLRELEWGAADLPETRVETFDLTLPEPDYDALLERIYQADSILVW